MLKKIILSLLLFCLVSPVSAWFDCYWPFRTEVAVTEATGITVTDYQVKIELDNTSFHASYIWSSDGQDIRFIDFDDITPVDFFIESWDAVSKIAVIWVELDLKANNTKDIYLYYGNTDSVTASAATQTFPELGIRFHTRNITSDPTSKTQGRAAFDAANDNVAGYGCTIVTNFSRINNRSQNAPPSINSNYGVISDTFFEVKASEVGLWSFRYGGDFGRGGGLYVNDVVLEESWNDDLWWAYNWNNPAEVFEGSINLTAGYHKLEAFGFEGCCDGPSDLEFKKPGGSYQTLSTAALDMRIHRCPVTEPTIAWDNLTLKQPDISIGKISSVLSDPVRGVNNPKRIPGAVVRYTLSVANAGTAAAEDSISIKDALPGRVKALIGTTNIGFTDGAQSSQLSFDYDPANAGTDDIGFSDNGGTSYIYTPTADGDGADSSISHLDFSPKGRFGCSNTATPASFSMHYDVMIK